jgi:hypothetical protein
MRHYPKMCPIGLREPSPDFSSNLPDEGGWCSQVIPNAKRRAALRRRVRCGWAVERGTRRAGCAHFTKCPNRPAPRGPCGRPRLTFGRLPPRSTWGEPAGRFGHSEKGTRAGSRKPMRPHPALRESGAADEMRLGLRRSAHRAQYARAFYHMREVAGGPPRRGPTTGELEG